MIDAICGSQGHQQVRGTVQGCLAERGKDGGQVPGKLTPMFPQRLVTGSAATFVSTRRIVTQTTRFSQKAASFLVCRAINLLVFRSGG